MKQQNVPGYSFPRFPEKWTDKEKQFGLALRNLFDRIFSDQETQDRTEAANVKALTETDEKLNSAIKKNADSIYQVNDRVDDLEEQIGDIGDVTDEKHGLMTPEMKIKLDGLPDEVEDSRPELDYLFMMSSIDLPTDTSDKATKLAGYYALERWNIQMVWDAVNKWITDDDYEDITGEPFTPDRPT